MFRLLPYYSAASAAVIVVMITSLTFAYRQIAVGEMVQSAETHNVAFARIFANRLWPQLSPFIEEMEHSTREQLQSHPTIPELERDVTELSKGLSVLKVKIYTPGGMTVYSSAPNQIGEDKSDNPGFLIAARQGLPSTKRSHREQFSTSSGVLLDREVVESYVPVQISAGAPAAVFELYADVTDLTDRIRNTTGIIVAITLLAFIIQYAVLFLIVRRADGILKDQYESLQDREKKLEAALEDLQKAEEKVRHAANHDALTGLPSLRLCKDRLSSALSLARRESSIMAIFFIDLDGFKGVNDTQGHDAGDHVLREIAQRLHSCVREMDTVARIGGDEFMIIFPKIANPDIIKQLGDKIIESVWEPIPWKSGELSVGASVGVSLYPEHGKEAEVLIKEADDAMYVAKRGGKNRYVIANHPAPAPETADQGASPPA